MTKGCRKIEGYSEGERNSFWTPFPLGVLGCQMEAEELRSCTRQEGWEKADKVQRAFQVRQDPVCGQRHRERCLYSTECVHSGKECKVKAWKLVKIM